MATSLQKYKLVFFAPLSAVLACKTAIFTAGAGRYPGPGSYTECTFTTTGIGQFRPGQGANPNVSLTESSVHEVWKCVSVNCSRHGSIRYPDFILQIGKIGKLEEVEEARVETLCVGRDVAVKAVQALKEAHPYEEPAYEVYKLEDM